MLVGRQWEVFSPSLGRFVDVSRFMSDAERAFRQRPVVNRLLYWFILTHARLTENPPVVAFQPATADRSDAQLAEVMDPIFKTLWQQIGMLEVIDRLMAWMIPCGQAFLQTRVDFTKGPVARVPKITRGPDGVISLGFEETHEGELTVDVLSPLETRGEWNALPWHEKYWHIRRSFLTPATVKERWGVVVEPDTYGQNVGLMSDYLSRILFGGGHYGAVNGRDGENGVPHSFGGRREDGYVCVDEMWEKPCEYTPSQNGSPGGRLLIVTHNKVLHDSERPFALRAASPIRSFAFVNVPGRPSGTSPQEMMNPIQRAYNRGFAQILEHRALMTNPIIELDANSGLDATAFISRPGAVIPVNKRPGVDAFRFVVPPQISNDVWRTQELLGDTIDVMGNVHGGQGKAPTSDASGQLVKELRFNSDRFIGPTAKRTVVELARLVGDWIVMLPSIWTAEKILTFAGEDNIVRTITVLPEMFDGSVNVVPDIESMLPEGRGERQARVQQLYQLGAFGMPGSPDAVRKFLELSRFPHLGRTIRPGGVHRVTAEHLLGKLLQGEPENTMPFADWYDYSVHLAVFEEYMASPDFLKLQPQVQAQLIIHRLKLKMELQKQLVQKAAEMGAMQNAVAPMIAPPGGATGPDGKPVTDRPANQRPDEPTQTENAA